MIEYFQHDYHARNDPKLLKIEVKLGRGARMTYWDLVEMMYENGGKLLISECDLYAFALRTECELLHELIYNFDVFQVSECGTFFYSNGVNKRLELRDEKSKKAQKSANARWNKPVANKEDNANAMRTYNDSNTIKEKKSKEKEIESKDKISKSTLRGESQNDSPPTEKTFLTFLLSGKDNPEFQVTEKMVDEFATYYPAVDIRQEIRNIAAWCVSNPSKRKTKAGAMKFINAWLSREQDKPQKNNFATNTQYNGQQQQQSPRIFTAQEIQQREKLLAAGRKSFTP